MSDLIELIKKLEGKVITLENKITEDFVKKQFDNR